MPFRNVCAALLLALGSGCMVLPPEARNLVSDAHRARSGVEQIDTRLADLRRELMAGMATSREDERAHFTQLNQGMAQLLARMAILERELRDLQARTGGPLVAGAAPPVAPADAATTGAARPAPPAAPASALDMLKQAAVYLDRGDYAQALDIYREILRQYPDADVADYAQLGVGKCLQYLDQCAEAIGALLLVPERHPTSVLVSEARFRAALCAKSLGDKMRALGLLNEIVANDPDYESIDQVKREIRDLGSE